MINHSEYPQQLPLKDSYQSDPNIKKPFFTTILFYWRVLRVVWISNRQAKKKIYNRYNWVSSSLNIIKAAESVGMKFSVKGMKNISSFEGPVVIVGNHMSTLETLLMPSFIQPVKRLVYVIKQELIDFPLFGPVASARFPIVVGRTNPREDLKHVMDEGSKKLQEGISIVIYPQKTRSAVFDSAGFNSLGVKLAKKNNVPVIPLALITDAWGNGKIIKEAGKIDADKQIHLEFGKPMKIEGNGSEQHKAVLDFITGKFKEWGRPELIK